MDEETEAPGSSALDVDLAKSGPRKRKKFIRKVPCQICGDIANDHIHYGAKCCYSCRAFFRRSISGGTKYSCVQSGQCLINKTTRRQCQACRLNKCFDMGMSDTWVMTESDKLEKKNAAEVRKRLKLQANTTNERNLDLSSVPLSSYLQKRAHFKQETRRNKSRLHSEYDERTRSLSGKWICLLLVFT